MADMNPYWFLVKFAVQLLIFFVAPPVIGGAILYRTLEKAKIPNFSYAKCAKAYYIAGALAFFVMLVASRWLTRTWDSEQQVMGMLLGLYVLTELLALPLLLRNFSRVVLVIEVLSIVLTTLIILGLWYLLTH